jgi:hypothetical protein
MISNSGKGVQARPTLRSTSNMKKGTSQWLSVFRRSGETAAAAAAAAAATTRTTTTLTITTTTTIANFGIPAREVHCVQI